MEGKTQEAAAAAAGMSVRTARTWERGALPSETKPPRHWRTRLEPFEGVWESELVSLLERDTERVLQATTLLEWLEEHYGGRFAAGQLRTLQRRVREWRAPRGPAREVYFEQKAVPGREAQLDFTHAKSLGVTIAGEPFDHLLFELLLRFSGWRFVQLAYGEDRRGAGPMACKMGSGPWAGCPRWRAQTIFRRRPTSSRRPGAGRRTSASRPCSHTTSCARRGSAPGSRTRTGRWSKGPGERPRGNFAFKSVIRDNAVQANGGDGIVAGGGCVITGNTASDNGDDGIWALGGDLVERNTAQSNTGYGLRAASSSGYRANVIDGNTAGTVTGGVDLGGNLCDGAATCP